MQKFNYLKAQLKGDVARTIAGIPLCDQKYFHSVTLLRDHLHRLITAHLQALLEISSPTNTLTNVRIFHDTTESHSFGLSSPTDIWGPVITNYPW